MSDEKATQFDELKNKLKEDVKPLVLAYEKELKEQMKVVDELRKKLKKVQSIMSL